MTAGSYVVARLARPHGVKGEVGLDVRTDRPARRLTPGRRFEIGHGPGPALTLESVRQTAKGWVARFAELTDRTAAEAWRGAELLAEPDLEDDAWYPDQLRGLPVELPGGAPVGHVKDVVALPAQDLLEIAEPGGTTALVPLVKALVPVVDLDAGRIVIDPPAGLVAARPALEG